MSDGLYDELIAPIEKQMKRTVFRIVRDPDATADAFQDVLAIVWRNLAKIRRCANPHAYILRVCVSVSYDAVRSRKRNMRGLPPPDLLIDGGPPCEAGVVGRETRREILAAITALPRRQAEAVWLRVVEDQPYAVIAGALCCREVTVRSHVAKGKASLRETLAKLSVL